MATVNKIPLMHEFELFKSRQSEFASKFDGKFIVIKHDDILGVYESLEEAFDTTSKVHEPGTFLIQQCYSGQEAYTAIFHSRVHF